MLIEIEYLLKNDEVILEEEIVPDAEEAAARICIRMNKDQFFFVKALYFDEDHKKSFQTIMLNRDEVKQVKFFKDRK